MTDDRGQKKRSSRLQPTAEDGVTDDGGQMTDDRGQKKRSSRRHPTAEPWAIYAAGKASG